MIKKTKFNGIKNFVQRIIQNNIFRNTAFINIRHGKVRTRTIHTYETTRSRRSYCRGIETNLQVDGKRFKTFY